MKKNGSKNEIWTFVYWIIVYMHVDNPKSVFGQTISQKDIKRKALWVSCLPVSFCFIILYEILRIWYSKSEKWMEDFYGSFLKLSAVILGIRHIGIYLKHKKSKNPCKEGILELILEICYSFYAEYQKKYSLFVCSS